MIAEIGQFALVLAFCFAFLQASMPLLGLAWQRQAWVRAAPTFAHLQFALVAIALVSLAVLFVQHDFSVAYVAQNSNTNLPLGYRISAVWGGHEGSLLLWVFMLALWTFAVALFSSHMAVDMRTRVIAILGWVSTGFLLLLLATSNPFARLSPIPLQGRDLNPLLQDPGLIIHPPMLYMGYVGFSVAFAFALAALLAGKMDSAWARWARPWTLVAWVFLTVGIMLGSWWAYYELGWGGWWFWDPVENASFMPWLVGTALLHSLAATEARGLFKPWTSLLAILTFLLCLLGTFLVRSGVLNSVHAFATDPERGLFILALMVITMLGSLSLYSWRAHSLSGVGSFGLVSRESGILANNVFLTVAAFSVLLGTMYPLLLDAMGLGKISVGPPYFNTVFVSLAVFPAAMAALGAASRWKGDSVGRLANKMALPFAVALLLGALAPLLASEYHWGAALGLALAFWIAFGTARIAVDRLAAGKGAWRSGGFWGMSIAHFGIAVFVAGVSLLVSYESERDVLLESGVGYELAGKVFTLERVFEEEGANYKAAVGLVSVTDEGKQVAVLRAEKRFYATQPDNPMTEAGIAPLLTGDLYVSLGEQRGNGVWSARVQVKPFIRLVWGGALLMALGGLVAMADRRYRRRNAPGRRAGVPASQ